MKERLGLLIEILRWLEENIEDINPLFHVTIDECVPVVMLEHLEYDDNFDSIDAVYISIYHDKAVSTIKLDEWLDSPYVIHKDIEKTPEAINQEFDTFIDLFLHAERPWREEHE